MCSYCWKYWEEGHTSHKYAHAHDDYCGCVGCISKESPKKAVPQGVEQGENRHTLLYEGVMAQAVDEQKILRVIGHETFLGLERRVIGRKSVIRLAIVHGEGLSWSSGLRDTLADAVDAAIKMIDEFEARPIPRKPPIYGQGPNEWESVSRHPRFIELHQYGTGVWGVSWWRVDGKTKMLHASGDTKEEAIHNAYVLLFPDKGDPNG